jgi:hypothetical protein
MMIVNNVGKKKKETLSALGRLIQR